MMDRPTINLLEISKCPESSHPAIMWLFRHMDEDGIVDIQKVRSQTTSPTQGAPRPFHYAHTGNLHPTIWPLVKLGYVRVVTRPQLRPTQYLCLELPPGPNGLWDRPRHTFSIPELVDRYVENQKITVLTTS